MSSGDVDRWELRSQLVTKTIEIAEREKTTQAEVAKIAHTADINYH